MGVYSAGYLRVDLRGGGYNLCGPTPRWNQVLVSFGVPTPRVAPWSFEKEEEERAWDALRRVRTRRVGPIPQMILARLSFRWPSWKAGHEAILWLKWLESDGDTEGIIVRECWPGGAEITEKYPLVAASMQGFRGDRGSMPFKNLPVRVGERDRHFVRIRTGNQRKNDHEWAQFMELPWEQRWITPRPRLWVSEPGEREVEIAVYDRKGRVSRFVPVSVERPSPDESAAEPED